LQARILSDGGLKSRNGDTRPEFDSLLVFQITFVKTIMEDCPLFIDPALKSCYCFPPIQQKTLNGWGTQVSVFKGRINKAG
jgi:hypothetical protein